jgi:hypothetical protein
LYPLSRRSNSALFERTRKPYHNGWSQDETTKKR